MTDHANIQAFKWNVTLGKHKYLNKFCALISLLLVFLICENANAGINDGLVEWIAQDATFVGVREVEFHPVIDNTGKQFEFDVAQAASQALKEQLIKGGIQINTIKSVASNLILETNLLHYQSGSVGGRWVGMGGGTTMCILRTQIIDGNTGRLLGDFTSASQVERGGLFSIGAEEKVPKTAAKLIANRILDLVGLKAEE